MVLQQNLCCAGQPSIRAGITRITMRRPYWKPVLATLIVLAAPATLLAQFQSVVFEPSRGLLNGGLPLPAETSWMITGPVAQRIGLVEARIYEDAELKHEWAAGRWERTEWSSAVTFSLPMDRMLRGSEEYTVVLGFYEAMPDAELTALADLLCDHLSAYVDQGVEISRNRTRLLKPLSRMMEELDILVNRGTVEQRSRLGLPFPGFSQLVEDKLGSLHSTRLSTARFSFKKEEEGSKADERVAFAREQIAELKKLIHAEARMYLAREIMVMRDRAAFTSMKSEHTLSTVALNLGFGGLYLSGPVDDISYSTAPFAGVSLPFGRRAFSSRFLSNSSLSVGVFLNNFEDELGKEITGPVIGRPLYLGYGYRIFRMVRLNAGGALLQRSVMGADGGTSDEISVRPFVGASIEFNLWIGMGK